MTKPHLLPLPSNIAPIGPMNIADWEANSSHVPWAGNDVFVVATSLAARVNDRQNFRAHSPNGPVALPAVDRRVAEVFAFTARFELFWSFGSE